MSLVSPFISEILRVTIDYDMSLEDMKAAGKYDWSNSNINAVNFPPPLGGWGKGKIKVDVGLACFNRFTELEEVLCEFEADGWRSGVLPELLAIGAEYPGKQIEFPVVEVGSVWPDLKRGGKRGVYLRRGNKERGLAFIWLDHGFPGFYRIIAVKK